MKVSVTARHFDMSSELKAYAEARLERFERFTQDLLTAHVVLEIQKYRNIAEVSVHGRHGDFTAKVESEEMETSIDGACEKVERQIQKNISKLRSHNGDGKEVAAMGDTRIESMQLNREMMTLDEATTRVEDGEEIVVFADTDSGATRVVYRRPNGSVKLIEIAE